MAWGSKTAVMTDQSVAGTELYSTAVTLNPGESADIQVSGNSSGTTDNLVIKVYGTLDDTTENWDTTAVWSQELDCTDGGPNLLSLNIFGKYKFRIGCVRSGSTDTITTSVWYRTDGINV